MKHYLLVTLLLLFSFSCFAQSGQKEPQPKAPRRDSLKEDPGGIDPGIVAPRDLQQPDKIFTYVEEMPAAGYNMDTYLKEHLHYPDAAREHNIEGRVMVKFLVKRDSSISDVTVVRGIGGGCDEEAIRVIAAMPKWKPGRQNGKNVSVYFSMPVVFRLQ